MVRDPLLGLDADEAAERRVAAQFGQARLVGRVAEQGGEAGAAPEGTDGVVVATAAPRRAEAVEDRRIGEGLEAAADRAQGGAIVEAGPVEDGLPGPDPHPPVPPSVAGVRLQREGYPVPGGRGV